MRGIRGDLYRLIRDDKRLVADGKNLFDMDPDERAAAGLFLAFQAPLELPDGRLVYPN